MNLLEILPLIEFQLDEEISDTDALKLIQNSYNESKPKEFENNPQKMNTLILDEESQDQIVDPFTYKLINLEVKYEFYSMIIIYSLKLFKSTSNYSLGQNHKN